MLTHPFSNMYICTSKSSCHCQLYFKQKTFLLHSEIGNQVAFYTNCRCIWSYITVGSYISCFSKGYKSKEWKLILECPYWEISQKWYFVTKIVLTYCEKKLFLWSRKTFEITRTIYSNSEKSEQFLVSECCLNLLLEVSQI